ncbi:MAG TPA: EboA domain-containing protein [Lunatimonas sp.]|nr:EboA domain-containing protein [Lunatimonas sp.]
MESVFDYTRITAYLLAIVKKQADANAVDWLQSQAAKIAGSEKSSSLFLSFSQASRFFPKDKLTLSDSDIAGAKSLRKDWRPETWNLLVAARAYLAMHVPAEPVESWRTQLSRLFETGDIYEQEALYATLCILPHQELLASRASEGLRSNMTTIFDAVALNNPFPAEQLNEMAWNQLVLKAIFLQRPMYQIIGIDARNNRGLAETLLDAVRERWSAHRSVMPELWRFVSPFIDETNIHLIKKLFQNGSELEIQAGMLACVTCKHPEVMDLVHSYPDIKGKIEAGEITWETVGKQYVPFQ